MDKEQILSTFKEKVGKTSLSEKTISDYIDAHLPAEGTEPDEAYWQRHTAFFKSLDGNYSADVAAQVNDFKKNYKPETKTTAGEGGEKGEKSDLERRLEQLEASMKKSSLEASQSTLRSEVIAQAKSLKVANEALWEDAAAAVQIAENDTAETLTARTRTIYEQRIRRYMGQGVAPYGSTGHQGASKQEEEAARDRRDAFKRRMQARGRLPKDEDNK